MLYVYCFSRLFGFLKLDNPEEANKKNLLLKVEFFYHRPPVPSSGSPLTQPLFLSFPVLIGEVGCIRRHNSSVFCQMHELSLPLQVLYETRNVRLLPRAVKFLTNLPCRYGLCLLDYATRLHHWHWTLHGTLVDQHGGRNVCYGSESEAWKTSAHMLVRYKVYPCADLSGRSQFILEPMAWCKSHTQMILGPYEMHVIVCNKCCFYVPIVTD